MIVNSWFDWTDRERGPLTKTYSSPCTSEIVVFHDAVGYLPGWYSRLFDMTTGPDGRFVPNAAASVTGWLPWEAGIVPIQHYPIDKSCWASGSYHLNIKGNAFENASHPIETKTINGVRRWVWKGTSTIVDWHNPPRQSDWQVECSRRILSDLSDHFDRPSDYWRRPISLTDLTATIYKHKETTRWGGRATSCPNGRIRDNDILAHEEEDDMPTIEEITDAVRVVVQEEIAAHRADEFPQEWRDTVETLAKTAVDIGLFNDDTGLFGGLPGDNEAQRAAAQKAMREFVIETNAGGGG